MIYKYIALHSDILTYKIINYFDLVEFVVVHIADQSLKLTTIEASIGRIMLLVMRR